MQKPGIDRRRMLGIKIKYLWVSYAGFKYLFLNDVILEEHKSELEANSCTKELIRCSLLYIPFTFIVNGTK